jgi:glutamine amidotransferase
MEVQIVLTGTSNLASMLAALQRAGGHPEPVREARQILEAERLVVPGVGAFAAARESLESAGLWAPLRCAWASSFSAPGATSRRGWRGSAW